MNPTFSVIIPTYQRPHLLRKCLEALAEQTLPADVFEVLVIDDGDDQQTALTVRQMAQQTGLTIRYLTQPERRGPAAARNRGWRVAIGQLIAFTDDDCLPERTWLESALARFRQNAQVLTGRLIMPLPDRPTAHDRTTALLESAEFITANLFCRRSVLERVGGFDEAFDSAWREDSELQFKIIRAGMPIESCPEAVIVHPMRPAPWYAPLRDERKNRYDALLYKRHPQLFRERIPAYAPLVRRYYATVIALIGSVGGGALGLPVVSLAGLVVWVVLTGWLFIERLPSQLTPAGVGQALITSLVTPFLSVFWRLYGAVKYRAWYW